MSDLAATNCGCGCDAPASGCGGCGNNMIWIILLLCCCGGYGHNGGGCGCGNGCDNSCIWIILLLCCCGGWGKWMRFRLLIEPASQETAGRLMAALSVLSLCIFFFLRPVFLFSPLALLIDLVDSISIYDKSSHVFSPLGWSPFPYILFPCPLFRAFFA